MDVSTKIKQAVAAIGLTGLLTANSGCLTAAGVVASPFIDVAQGSVCAYEIHPLLTPVGGIVGILVSPLTFIPDGRAGFEADLEMVMYIKDRLSSKDSRQDNKHSLNEGGFAYYRRRLALFFDE
ncbi:hypothetical protein HY485_02975 [Candidatus Woesearchaeota archaeon]|nr:hypothetical protein [Candidatus Woesearchaeota archaeon]